MRVRDFYGQGRAVFSLEIFPPKTEPGLAKLKRWLEEATACGPDFISVTYGAGGGTRQGTHELCAYIKDRFPTECMAHLTCVAHTQAHIAEVLNDLAAAGVENVMALRGDPPQGEGSFSPPPDGFRHAAELVRSIAAQERFCIGVAGYPEGHVEAPGYEADLRRQAEKIAAGADLVVDGRDISLQGYEDGFFIGGCLFDRVTTDMSIYTDEIFGPVLSVVRADDYEHALKMVNDHEYGNGTAIFTRDGDAARDFASRANIGMIGVNVPIPVPVAYHSFGGWKRSLFGDHYVHGMEGIRFYTRLKTVTARWPSGIRTGAQFNFKSGADN